MLSPFSQLAAAAALFVGGHFALSATPVRTRLIARLGARGFLGVYSAVALAAFVWMIWSFRQAPYLGLWGSPAWARLIVFAVMPIALILITAGYLTPNPSAVMGDTVLKRDDPAPGIFKVTRHPVMLGIALWATAHLLANGDMVGILLFGSLLVLALGGIAHMERKRRASGDADWRRLTAITSIVPFAAVIGGRTKLAVSALDWARVGLGLALYAVLLTIHGWAFGVYLIGKP